MTTVNTTIHTEPRAASGVGVTYRVVLKQGGSTVANVSGPSPSITVSAPPGEYNLEVEKLTAAGQPVAPAYTQVLTVPPYMEEVPVGVTITFAP